MNDLAVPPECAANGSTERYHPALRIGTDLCSVAAGRPVCGQGGDDQVLRPARFWPDWCANEVRNDPGGWRELLFTWPPAWRQNRGIVSLGVSLSRDGSVAGAVVIAQLGPS